MLCTCISRRKSDTRRFGNIQPHYYILTYFVGNDAAVPACSVYIFIMYETRILSSIQHNYRNETLACRVLLITANLGRYESLSCRFRSARWSVRVSQDDFSNRSSFVYNNMHIGGIHLRYNRLSFLFPKNSTYSLYSGTSTTAQKLKKRKKPQSENSCGLDFG